jgi:hypothetical protein
VRNTRTYNILAEISEGKEALGELIHILEDNIKMDL